MDDLQSTEIQTDTEKCSVIGTDNDGRVDEEVKRRGIDAGEPENRKRKRSSLRSGGSGDKTGDGMDDDALSSSSSDHPRSTSDSREEASSSNNSSEENEPVAHSSTRKKRLNSTSTSTKSTTTSCSSSSSNRDVQFVEKINPSRSGGVSDESSNAVRRQSKRLLLRGATSDLTSEDVSSSDNGDKRPSSSNSSKDKVEPIIASERRDKKTEAVAKGLSFSSDGASFGQIVKSIENSQTIASSIRTDESIERRSSYNTSGSEIDAIIRRAQNGAKSSESSTSSSNERSDATKGPQFDIYGIERRSSYNTSGSEIDAIIQRAQNAAKNNESSSSSSDERSDPTKRPQFAKIRTHRGYIDHKNRRHKSHSQSGSSSSGSVRSSKGVSNDESFSGSLSTSCLDGIISVGNIGDGALSSSCSGGDALKHSESSGSSSDSDNLSTRRNQAKSTQESVESMQGCDTINQSTQKATPGISPPTTSTAKENNSMPVPPSMMNPALLIPPARPHQVLPIHLDYCLIKRMESILFKSQESQQQLKEWDKMMGLNSSHSFTMTRSAKSRKKLLNQTKRWLKKLGDDGKL